jgi:formate dehydrogenase alpha subunit
MTNSIADMTQAKAILAIGTNTTENHPVISLKIKEAVRKHGAKLIVADPRQIELADFATLYLQHEAGTDLALLNGLAYIIVNEKLYDHEFVETRTENFEAWLAVIEDYPPDLVSQITGVPVPDLERAARLYASHKPASIFYAMGITQHSMGHQNVLAVANLAMLCGNLGVAGGGVNPLRGQNNVQGSCDMGGLPNVYPGYQKIVDEAVREKFAAYHGTQQPPAKVGLTVTEMMNAAHDGRVRALYIMGENPAMSDPDVTHVRASLDELEFLVVQDIFLNETTDFADVVLPAAAFAEKDGTFTNTERRVQRVRKVFDPPGEAHADWQIFIDLANRMGQNWHYESPAQIMDEIAEVTPIYGGIHYDRLEGDGLQWGCPSREHAGTPILHIGKFARGLGKFTPVHHQAAVEMPDDEYPFILTTGRLLEHFHTGTMTRRVAGLDMLVPEERIEIHPDDAAKLGIQNGDCVRVSSRRGSVLVKAWVLDRPRRGMVFMTFHFAEALGNILTNTALDPVSKIPELKVCAVKIATMEVNNMQDSGL